MNKTKIAFIDDLHGVKKIYYWQVEQINNIKPDVVMLEMLPNEPKYIKLCKSLALGNTSVDQFATESDWESHWSSFSGYKILIDHLAKQKIPIYPIDYALEKRYEISKTEKQIIDDNKKGLDSTRLINKNRIRLFLEREVAFCDNILKYHEDHKPKSIVAIVGGNHVERLVNFFNFLDEFEAKGIMIKKDLKTQLYPTFKNIHLKFAEENNIMDMKNPPLVPINVLRWTSG